MRMTTLICPKDGSQMWERETFPGFSIWSCFAAAHHVRIGAPPPPVQKPEERRGQHMKVRRQQRERHAALHEIA